MEVVWINGSFHIQGCYLNRTVTKPEEIKSLVGSTKHLWSMFYNKSHIGGPDALARGPRFRSVLVSCFLSQLLFFHKAMAYVGLLCHVWADF